MDLSWERWVHKPSHDFKTNKLSSEKVAELEALPGWTWDLLETQYQEALNCLIKFIGREGMPGFQRIILKTGLDLAIGLIAEAKFKSTSFRLKKLLNEAIPGWTWNVLETQYQEGMGCLIKFAIREGHSRVRYLILKMDLGWGLGKQTKARFQNQQTFI